MSETKNTGEASFMKQDGFNIQHIVVYENKKDLILKDLQKKKKKKGEDRVAWIQDFNISLREISPKKMELSR